LVASPPTSWTYSHLAARKEPSAQAQTRTAMEAAPRSAGTRTKRARPNQKREKRRATPKAKTSVEKTKAEKMRMGVEQKTTCATRAD
jgi:hypothetical protein